MAVELDLSRPLRDRAEHAAALAELHRLWGSPGGTPDGDRLSTLLLLVDAYESVHDAIDPPDPTTSCENKA